MLKVENINMKSTKHEMLKKWLILINMTINLCIKISPVTLCKKKRVKRLQSSVQNKTKKYKNANKITIINRL